MIIIKEINDNVNVIHLIIGAESEFQFDFNGFISIPLDDKLEKDKPNFLHINRANCDEADLTEFIVDQKVNFKPMPQQPQPQSKQPANKVVDDKYGTFYKELKCPKCNTIGVYVKNGEVQKCLTCFKIDDGIEKVTPISPEEKTILDGIVGKKRKKKDG